MQYRAAWFIAAALASAGNSAAVGATPVTEFLEPLEADGFVRPTDLVHLDDGSSVVAMLAARSVGDVAIAKYGADGEELWRHGFSQSTGIVRTYTPIAVTAKGRIVASIYAGGATGDLMIVYAPDGSELAAWEPGFRVARRMLAQGETVLLIEFMTRRRVHRFALDGALLASHEVPASIDGMWALPEGGVALALSDGTVRQLGASLQLVGDTVLDADLHVLAPAPGGGVLAGGVADFGGNQPAVAASIDAGAALGWTRSSVSWQPQIRLVGMAPHTAGVYVLGTGQAVEGDCLFEGNVALDGTTFDSVCSPLPGLPNLDSFGSSAGTDGTRMLLSASGAGSARVVDVRKSSLAPASLSMHAWTTPGALITLAGGAYGTAALVTDRWTGANPVSSLVRWEQAETPVFERLLPSTAENHTAWNAFEDSQGNVLFAVSGGHASHVVKVDAAASAVWEREVPIGQVLDFFESDDGRYFVFGDASVVALTRGGQIAWTYLPDDIQGSIRMAPGTQGRALLGYNLAGGCRVRVVGADGSVKSDESLSASGYIVVGMALADGRSVWQCNNLQGVSYFHRDADGIVVPVDTGSCGLPAWLQPLWLGGTRWALSGFADGAQRVCVYDGAQFIAQENFGRTDVVLSGSDLVRSDQRGTLIVAFAATSEAGASFEQLTVHANDMASSWLSKPNPTDEQFVAIAPPRAGGSPAWLLRGTDRRLRLVSGRNGALDWNAVLSRGMESELRLLIGPRGPLLGHSPRGSLDDAYFGVALLPDETAFADGFE